MEFPGVFESMQSMQFPTRSRNANGALTVDGDVWIVLRREWDLTDEQTQMAVRADGSDTTLDKLKGRIKRDSALLMREIWRKARVSTTTEVGPMRSIERARCECAFFECPLSPHSNGRLAWDMLRLVFVIYEIISIPVVFLVIPDDFNFKWLEWLLNIFWSIDIVLTFATATTVHGEIKTDIGTIAKKYASTWLLLDLLMVIPEWILSIHTDDGRKGFTVLRSLRIMRVLRVLRVLKLEPIIRRQLNRANSLTVLNGLSMLLMLFTFGVLNHIFACVFFFIGKHTENGFQDEGGWLVQQGLGQQDLDAYVVALHFSIATFLGESVVEPGNMTERIFAMCLLVVGMAGLSIFVSFTTNMILQMRQAHKKRNEQKHNIRMYFLRHNKVSTELMLQVKGFLESAMNDERECIDDDREVLRGLPLQMQKNVLFEARGPTVSRHVLYAWIQDQHEAAFRNLCFSAFCMSQALAGTIVFEKGDAWERMIFIEDGQLKYIQPQTRGSKADYCPTARPTLLLRQITKMHYGIKIKKKSWLGELALWVHGWQNQGDLIAVSDSRMLCIDSASFVHVLKDFPVVHLNMIMYAHSLVQEVMGEGPDIPDDLWMSAANLSP